MSDDDTRQHPSSTSPPSFHSSSIMLSAEAVVIATGKGSGGEPLSCIQRFSGRKVIRELLFSMPRQYKRERWKYGRRRQEHGKEMKGEKGLKKREIGGAAGREGEEGKKSGSPERDKTRHKLTYKRRKGSNRAVKNKHILRLERRGLDARQPVEKILYRVVSKKDMQELPR